MSSSGTMLANNSGLFDATEPTYAAPSASATSAVAPGSGITPQQLQVYLQQMSGTNSKEVAEMQIAFQQAQMQLLQIPEFQAQVAQNAAINAQNDKRIGQTDTQIQHAIAQDALNTALATTQQQWQQAYQNNQLDLSKISQAAQSALQGAKQASDAAIARNTLGVNTMGQVNSDNIARLQLGSSDAANANNVMNTNTQTGLGALNQSDQFAVSNLGQGINAAGQAQQGAYNSQQLALQAANDQNNTALQALQMATQGGPRNAFQQQAMLHGLNQMGISNSIAALQGTQGMPLFEGYHASPQARTLQTIAEDAAAAGPGGGNTNSLNTLQTLQQGANGALTAPGQLLLQAGQRSISDPYGPHASALNTVGSNLLTNPYQAGGQMLLGAGAGALTNPLGYGAQAMMNNAQDNIDNPYADPAIAASMQVSGNNVGNASLTPDFKITQGGGKAVQQTYKDLLSSRQSDSIYKHLLNPQLTAPGAMDAIRKAYAAANGDEAKVTAALGYDPFKNADGTPLNQINRDALVFEAGGGSTPTLDNFFKTNNVYNIPPNDPQYQNAIATTYGLNAQQASAISGQLNNFHAQNGYPMPADQMDNFVNRAKQDANFANLGTPQGKAMTATNNYNAALAANGGQPLTYNDPRTLGIYESSFGIGQDQAYKQAMADAATYKNTGTPATTGQMANTYGYYSPKQSLPTGFGQGTPVNQSPVGQFGVYGQGTPINWQQDPGYSKPGEYKFPPFNVPGGFVPPSGPGWPGNPSNPSSSNTNYPPPQNNGSLGSGGGVASSPMDSVQGNMMSSYAPQSQRTIPFNDMSYSGSWNSPAAQPQYSGGTL